MQDPDGPTSFYELLLEEAVGPFHFELGRTSFAIDPPCAIDAARIEEAEGPVERLDLLTAGTHLELLDELLRLLQRAPAGATTELADAMAGHFALLVPPADGTGLRAVVYELEVYGAALEADLAVRGLDLHDWVRDPARHPWGKLLRLAQTLPAGSHYAAARALDKDLAHRIAELRRTGEIPRPSGKPSLVGWTAEREMLQQIADSLRRVEHGTWAASPKFRGKGGTPPKPAPRPATADDSVRMAERLTEHDELMNALLGDRYKPLPGERIPSADAVRGAVLLDF